MLASGPQGLSSSTRFGAACQQSEGGGRGLGASTGQHILLLLFQPCSWLQPVHSVLIQQKLRCLYRTLRLYSAIRHNSFLELPLVWLCSAR